MATVSSYRDLRVWQTAIQLASDVYNLTGDMPAADKSDLATNLQRAAVDIPTLIATGHKSLKRSVFHDNCLRALNKTDELETLVVICGELHPTVPSNDILDQLEEVRQSLVTVIKKLDAQKTGNQPGKPKPNTPKPAPKKV